MESSLGLACSLLGLLCTLTYFPPPGILMPSLPREMSKSCG